MSIPPLRSCLNNIFSPTSKSAHNSAAATPHSYHQVHFYQFYVKVHLHLNDHKIIMDSPLFSAAYIILGINENGLPDSIIPHYNNKGTYISAAITLALAWTKTPVGRQPYIVLAADFLPQSIDSWRKDLTDEQVADMFFTKLYAYFCYVLVTKQWKNENYYSCHYRRISGPDGRNFDTRNQAIVINGVVSRRQRDRENSVME